MVFFFFQKKKQKALFCFAEDHWHLDLREAEPRGFGGWPPKNRLTTTLRRYLVDGILPFTGKEAKSVVLLRRGSCTCKGSEVRIGLHG
jgi:hypothetical protein